jgi:hypothetical protein
MNDDFLDATRYAFSDWGSTSKNYKTQQEKDNREKRSRLFGYFYLNNSYGKGPKGPKIPPRPFLHPNCRCVIEPNTRIIDAEYYEITEPKALPAIVSSSILRTDQGVK